jgi:hypothetical protein
MNDTMAAQVVNELKSIAQTLSHILAVLREMNMRDQPRKPAH